MHDRTRRIEFARFLVGEIGKMLDKVFVRLTQQVRIHIAVGKVILRKVFNQIDEQPVGELILIAPLSIAKYSVQVFLVGLFNSAQCIFNGKSYVGSGFSYIFPMTAFRDNKAVKLRKRSIFLVTLRFL